jgi:hypothetical protein
MQEAFFSLKGSQGMTKIRSVGVWILVLGALALIPATASADSYTLDFLPTNTFSGTAPAGTLSATFSDVSGGVQLVITSSLAAGENLDAGGSLYFNINPTKSSLLSGLNFALTANTGFSQAASVATGENAFKADGDGYYDILFSYAPSTKAFTSGESQTYSITGGAISAFDFANFFSSPGGGNGTWLSAIHVQNTPSGGQGSAWVGGTPDGFTPVPEPSSLAILAIGAVGLVSYRLRRRVP